MNSLLKQFQTDDLVMVRWADRWTDGRVALGGCAYPLVEVTGAHRPAGMPKPTVLVRSSADIRRRD